MKLSKILKDTKSDFEKKIKEEEQLIAKEETEYKKAKKEILKKHATLAAFLNKKMNDAL